MQLIETISILGLVQLSYLFSLCYMTSNWLAYRGILSPLLANVIRLLSSIMAVVVVTLMLMNHISQYVLLVQNFKGFFGPALGFLIIPGLYWLIMLVRSSGAHLLGATLMTVPLYAFILLIDHDSLLLKFPPLVSFLFVYVFPLVVLELWGESYYDVLQGFSKGLSARYARYKHILDALLKNDYEDKPGLVLSTVCGLTLSILNFLQVYQTCTNLASYVTLLIIAGSIVLNVMLGFGLVSIARNVNVTFYYNFIIQIYINFFNNFKRIFHQIKQNQLPRVGLKNFVLTLILGFTVAPAPSYCMDHETGSTIELPDFDDTDPNKQAKRAQPVSEGQRATKAARTLGDAAKPHIEDTINRTVDKAKDAVAITTVGLVGASIYQGFNQGKEALGLGTSTQLDDGLDASTVGRLDSNEGIIAQQKEIIAELEKNNTEQEKEIQEKDKRIAELEKRVAEQTHSQAQDPRD